MALQEQILDLEEQFWEAMKTKDAKTAAEMTGDASIIAGATGVATISPAIMRQMLAEGNWTLEDYQFADVQVREVSPDAAIIGYKVTEHLTVEDAPIHFTAYDTSMWHRQDGRWTCVLHTESVEGDPFGRDRRG
jgi:hypothetical protein